MTAFLIASLFASHILFGDLRIEGAEPEEGAASSFVIMLTRLNGQEFKRDIIPPNGRYRFSGVPNGEYYLVVQVGVDIVYKEQVMFFEQTATDIRKDISLQWKTTGGTSASPASVYARGGDQQRKLEEAQGEVQRGDLAKARKLFEEILKKDPKDFEAETEYGSVLFREEKFKESEAAYRKALAARSDYLPALVNLGKVLIAAKNYEQAIDPLTKAATAEPTRAETHYLLGEAYLGMKKGSKAVGYLNEAIRLDPEGMADVHLRLAILYDGAKMKDRAAAEYREYLKKKPNASQKAELEKYIKQNSAQ